MQSFLVWLLLVNIIILRCSNGIEYTIDVFLLSSIPLCIFTTIICISSYQLSGIADKDLPLPFKTLLAGLESNWYETD